MEKEFSQWNKSVPRYDELQQFVIGSINKNTHDEFTCLELGIGKGGTAYHLLQKFTNAKYTGIDSSADAIKHCKRVFQDKNACTFVEENIQKYEFEPNTDVVVSVLSLHHLDTKEKLEILKKIHTNLNDGGILVVGDLVRLEDESEDVRAAQIFSDYRNKVLNADELDLVNKHILSDTHDFETVAVMRNLFIEAGFSKVDIIWMYYRLGVFRVVK